MNKQLAKITRATFEIQERGILNFWIYVDYEEGCSQGVGGFALDRYDKEKDKRIGTAYGCEMIRRILLVMGVNDFSELKGKMVWIYGGGEGSQFTPKGLSPLRVESTSGPLIFDDIAREFGVI